MPKKNEPEDFFFRPFRNLKKMIKAEAVISPAPKDEPPKPKCPDDEELFLIEMKSVREIKEFRQIPVRGKVNVPPLKKRQDVEKEVLKTLQDISQGRSPIRLQDTQEYIEWTNSAYGYHAVVAKQLHEGRFAVQDLLDLHGYTAEEAAVQVEGFMKSSLTNGLRCIKIIHGRGLKSPQGPVLKDALLKWLSSRYRKNLIAFSTARQCDGGLGALYILLKQNRGRNK
ncbi:MAG: Smr/MutS family protein [Dissulfurispiraceae bacterium]|jgi:DNA-nicking Smr family endonuclease